MLSDVLKWVWNFLFDHIMYQIGFAVLASICIWIILDLFGILSPPKFPGIFEIPGLPIIGNYFQIRNNPALKYMEWHQYYKQDIFQIRIGNKRIIVVNSFQAVADIWKKSCLNSRPFQYTFHNIVSSTKGFTIGTTPWSDSYKRRKQVISQALNNQNLKNLIHILDNESCYTIKQLIKHNKDYQYQPSTNPTFWYKDVSMLKYFQYFTLRTSVLITYGFKLDCFYTDKNLCDNILYYENQIIKFRSPIANLDDYFPILRFIKTLFNYRKSMSITSRIERDNYMKILYDRFTNYYEAQLQETDSGHDDAEKYFPGNIIGKYYLDSNHKKINYDELQSICLTMISAGLDNTPLNLDHLLGQLSYYPKGHKFQEVAVNELLSIYKGNLTECWHKIAIEMNSHFIIALIKETLRYFTVLPLSLPRVTTKDINYQGIVIPQNCSLIMNAYGANHDSKVFKKPDEFDPYRWLDHDNRLISEQLIGHFAFGKGVRMCSGNILAFKEMYILIGRLLLLFKIRPPTNKAYKMISNPFKNNNNPRATSFDPKEFRIRLVPRILPGSDDLFNYILK